MLAPARVDTGHVAPATTRRSGQQDFAAPGRGRRVDEVGGGVDAADLRGLDDGGGLGAPPALAAEVVAGRSIRAGTDASLLLSDMLERDLEQIPNVAVGQLVVDVPAFAASGHELSVAQDAELMRHRRLLTARALSDLVHTQLLSREEADEHESTRIPESLEGVGEPLSLALRQRIFPRHRFQTHEYLTVYSCV